MGPNKHSIYSSKEYVEYIDELEGALKDKTRQLQSVENDIANATSAFTAQQAKVNTIKTLWDQVYGTNDIANKTIAALMRSIDLSHSAGNKAGYINEALRRNVINIEDMAYMIKDELQANIKILKDGIGDLNSKPDPSSKIMASIDTLSLAIDDALGSACTALDAVLPVFQKSTLLQCHLQNAASTIELELTEGGETVVEKVDVVGLPITLNAFVDKITNEDIPFPYNTSDEETDGKGFYKTIKSLLEEEKRILRQTETILNEKKKEKLLTQDKKDAIASSLEAAKAASAC